MDIKKMFWEKLKYEKLRKDLLYREIAEASEVHESSVRMAFKKEESPKVSRAFALCQGVEINIIEALGKEGLVTKEDHAPKTAEEAIANFWKNVDALGGKETSEDSRKAVLIKTETKGTRKDFVQGQVNITIAWLEKVAEAYDILPYQLLCNKKIKL